RNWLMNRLPGATTGCDSTLPDFTSTNSSRTSLGGADGVGSALVPALSSGEGRAEAGAATLGSGLGLGAGDAGDPEGSADPPPPATGWTRMAAIVLPSGDHQNPTTCPSSSVRTVPAVSRSRSGPNGKSYWTAWGSLGPIEATMLPAGSKLTA